MYQMSDYSAQIDLQRGRGQLYPDCRLYLRTELYLVWYPIHNRLCTHFDRTSNRLRWYLRFRIRPRKSLSLRNKQYDIRSTALGIAPDMGVGVALDPQHTSMELFVTSSDAYSCRQSSRICLKFLLRGLAPSTRISILTVERAQNWVRIASIFPWLRYLYK